MRSIIYFSFYQTFRSITSANKQSVSIQVCDCLLFFLSFDSILYVQRSLFSSFRSDVCIKNWTVCVTSSGCFHHQMWVPMMMNAREEGREREREMMWWGIQWLLNLKRTHHSILPVSFRLPFFHFSFPLGSFPFLHRLSLLLLLQVSSSSLSERSGLEIRATGSRMEERREERKKKTSVWVERVMIRVAKDERMNERVSDGKMYLKERQEWWERRKRDIEGTYVSVWWKLWDHWRISFPKKNEDERHWFSEGEKEWWEACEWREQFFSQIKCSIKGLRKRQKSFLSHELFLSLSLYRVFVRKTMEHRTHQMCVWMTLSICCYVLSFFLVFKGFERKLCMYKKEGGREGEERGKSSLWELVCLVCFVKNSFPLLSPSSFSSHIVETVERERQWKRGKKDQEKGRKGKGGLKWKGRHGWKEWKKGVERMKEKGWKEWKKRDGKTVSKFN